MTQLRRAFADGIAGRCESSEGSDAGDEGEAGDLPFNAQDLADAGAGQQSWGDARLDLDGLCQTLQGLPPADAEEEIRSALRSAGAEVTAANTLGAMLKVFRQNRESSVEGYEGWDVPVAYCDWLVSICDQNFVGVTGAESANGTQDFPAVAVAGIYAECGRTLALAAELPAARDRLQKALNIYNVLPQLATSEALRLQQASTISSLARVLRRMGAQGPCLSEYFKALQIFAEVPTTDDFADFIGEYCEVLGDAGADELSNSMPGLLAELAEEKLGGGSKEHLRVLRDVADLCLGVGKPALAAPALATRARLLREEAQASADALALAELATEEEQAAQAMEAAVAISLEEADLERAAGCWEEALHFRELLEPKGSSLVAEMRNSLLALQMAAAERAGAREQPPPLEAAPPQRIAEVEIAEEEEEVAKPAPAKPSLTQISGLRPSAPWASGGGARQEAAAEDAWDD